MHQKRRFITKRRHPFSKNANPNRYARKVEKTLVRGVDDLMRQDRRNRIKMFNDWKMMFDNKGRQIVLI